MMSGKKYWRMLAGVVCAVSILTGLSACGSTREVSPNDAERSDPSYEETSRHLDVSDDIEPISDDTGGAVRITPQEPVYEDARWPTTNPQLLAVPEENRYYNAWNHVWTTCTVAGPVVNVYQAKDAAGAPIFISIGERYPSSNCVTLVVWADAYNDFARMINAVDDGGAWLSVTGYLSEYNGGLQFDIGDGYVEYTWWE